MTRRITLLLATGLFLAGAASAPLTQPAIRPATAPATTTSRPAATTTTSRPATTSAPAARSTLDGVFNDAQVVRGKQNYLVSCSRCHGETLGGNDDAAALVGEEFIGKWTNKPVSELVEYTRLEMPGDSPGRMPRKEIVDITVYLLSANGVPAGKAELSSELDDLKRVQLQVKK
jgi:mono/diheme cytochrome c family protein